MTRLVCALALAAAFAGPAAATAGTIAVGLAEGASAEEVGSAVELATGARLESDLGPLDALVFSVEDPDRAAALVDDLPGVEYSEAIRPGERRLAFVPDDPLLDSQWYVGAIRAFEHWAALPPQPPVRVAVVDSGVDGGHPDLAGRIAGSRSFVGTSALVDEFGHGTIVAGEIAASVDNGVGIAGVGIPVELLVAKVVGAQGGISIADEARAIRWAVDEGARVINLSLGGPRNPARPGLDTYSALEHDAVDYATRHGVVVVAAAGNCGTLSCPERYANWPAALPHVIGVGALEPDGSTPSFSNRDLRHVDLAAPGTQIASLYPRPLSTSGCEPAGYTECADPSASRNPQGTSFSAPLVTAAAAVLLGERALLGDPTLHASQTALVLGRSATDIAAGGRDARSGAGRLDVAGALGALAAPLPPRDRYEPNDDAGPRALPLANGRRRIEATLERWDDRRDVFRIGLRRGERIVASVVGPPGSDVNLFLWRPGTEKVGLRRADRAARALGPGRRERLVHRATARGLYSLELRLPTGAGGAYELTLSRSG